jgi:hypothetical protein
MPNQNSRIRLKGADRMTSRRYGMRASTIRYFQGQGKLLAQLRGPAYARSAIVGSLNCELDHGPADAVGHMIIELAAVADAAYVQYMLVHSCYRARAAMTTD